MKPEERRTDEECVYDVHGFVKKYMSMLKTQKIPFKKEQIGVLEQMLLAENPVFVKLSREDERERLLNATINRSLMRSLALKRFHNYTHILNVISRFGSVKGSHVGNYSAPDLNRDALSIYNNSILYKEGLYLVDIIEGREGNRFGEGAYRLLVTYLEQIGLLPPEQNQSSKNTKNKDL